MDWFLYDNGLRHERVKEDLPLYWKAIFTDIIKTEVAVLRKGVLENFTIFTGKHLKETPTQVLFCECREIFKNTYFKEHLRMTLHCVRYFLSAKDTLPQSIVR